MFESLEIRKVQNGFILTVNLDDESNEYVFDSSRKAFKFMKDFIEAKSTATTND
jgi:hypothetical protein